MEIAEFTTFVYDSKKSRRNALKMEFHPWSGKK